MTDLLKRVHLLLRAGGSTIATAESLTGGRLAVALTDVPGASETYLGGVVSYATEIKSSVLDVDDGIIDRHGVISPECAKAMASGVRAVMGATYGISTTGVAGPADQEGKPAGTVFVGIAGPGMLEAVALELTGKRVQIQDRTCREAFEALEAVLLREDSRLG